jgi:hypothetical protein
VYSGANGDQSILGSCPVREVVQPHADAQKGS